MKNRIREIMQAQGMTIQKLANKSGVSRRTVQNIVNGMESCHMETMVKLAEALGVSLAEIFLEPYEQIVRYGEKSEEADKAEIPGTMEIAEEHGAYSVPADRETSEGFAEAIFNCFGYLPQEVQREFFQLCYCNGKRK